MKPLSYEEFKSIYSRVPRLCVDVVIVVDGGVVLTLRSIKPYLDHWHLPGGTVYMNESIEEAVKRVVLEEVGVVVEIDKFLNYLEFPSERIEAEFGRTVSLAFLVHIVSGKLRGGEQGEQVKIFKNAPEKIVPEHGKFLVEMNFLKV